MLGNHSFQAEPAAGVAAGVASGVAAGVAAGATAVIHRLPSGWAGLGLSALGLAPSGLVSGFS